MSSTKEEVAIRSVTAVQATPVLVTTTAVPPGGSQYQQSHAIKQGHSCCGGCCDMRRAVIIINAINIVLTIVYLILFFVGVEYIRRVDNETTDEIEDELTPAVTGTAIGIAAAGMVASAIGIYGALKYKMWAVTLTLLWYGADLILSIIWFNITGIIITAVLYLYPHGTLLHHLQNGIMTEETYPAEEQSCCCV